MAFAVFTVKPDVMAKIAKKFRGGTQTNLIIYAHRSEIDYYALKIRVEEINVSFTYHW